MKPAENKRGFLGVNASEVQLVMGWLSTSRWSNNYRIACHPILNTLLGMQDSKSYIGALHRFPCSRSCSSVSRSKWVRAIYCNKRVLLQPICLGSPRYRRERSLIQGIVLFLHRRLHCSCCWSASPKSHRNWREHRCFGG